jgi:glucose/arabinose dehydrogenase
MSTRPRAHRLGWCAGIALALAALTAPARAGDPAPGFSDTLVVRGLAAPTAIAFLPDGRLLITEKGGALKLFSGGSASTLVTLAVCPGSEMGLLGVAVDPRFASNGFIYLYRTKPGPAGCGGSASGRVNQVVRVTMSGAGVSLGSLAELLSGIAADNGNHNGGVLRMGPDDKLWVGVGDAGVGDNLGGPGSSTNPYAQALDSLNGKILRLNLNGGVPADNPFVNTPGARGEIWAYGFRNPFRMSFDGPRLWIGDVGDRTVEEIDIGVAGGNYSWPRCEGNLQGPPSAPEPCEVGADIAPVFTYPRSGPTSLGRCVVGGAFAGSAFGPAAGDYVFGDCVSSTVFRAALNPARTGFAGAPQPVSTGAVTPADFVRGPDGGIYYAAIGAGEIRRLAAVAAGSDIPVIGATLTIRDNPSNPVQRMLTATSNDPAIDLGGDPNAADDPTAHGALLRVLSGTGSFDSVYELPASGWRPIGSASNPTGYRYTDPRLRNGPVTRATLKARYLTVTAKGAGLRHPLGVNPDPVAVVLDLGETRYCMSFGASTGAALTFSAGKQFIAKHASAPPACPP